MTQDLTNNGAVVLPSVMDLRATETLKPQILAARGQALQIDASAVERLGGLGLQLLLSTIHTWKTDGQVLAFLNVSEAMIDQWQGFGAPLNELTALDATA